MERLNSVNLVNLVPNFRVKNSKLKTMLILLTTLVISIFTITICQATLYTLTDRTTISTGYNDVKTNATGSVNINDTAILEGRGDTTSVDIWLTYKITDWHIYLDTGKQFNGTEGYIQLYNSYYKIDGQFVLTSYEDYWYFDDQIRAWGSGYGPLYFGDSYDNYSHDLLNDLNASLTLPKSIYLQGDFDSGWCALYLESNASPVPEPATMLVFCVGLAGIAGSRLRRKKN
jgi:hypothetical protein